MVIDISTIDGEIPFEFSPKSEELELETENYRIVGSPAVTGVIARHPVSVEITATIDASAEVDCTRCLSLVAQPVSIEFKAEFLTEGELGSGGEHEVDLADLDTEKLESDQLDLISVVREQIVLNIPAQLLCREDCKGLCTKCGENLNLLDCNCGDDEIDPRWAALKDLKNSLN